MAFTTKAVSADDLEIPLIDFSAYLTGTSAARSQTASAILQGFQTAGFIYLTNHGIPSATISTVFAHSARFFARPLAQKTALSWTTPESNRGYVARGREKVTQATDAAEVEKLRAAAPDLKESFETGREGQEGYPNRWPDGFDEEGRDFTRVMKDFFDVCQELNVQVMRAIAMGMGLEEHFFDGFVDAADNNLRLLHYPPVRREVFERNREQVRAGEHSDYGSITLLFQDSRGGLQVRSPRGTFVDATPIPDTIVVNAGDLLERWSNDTIRSSKHRVVQPPLGPEGDEYPARYSVVYFGQPNIERHIEALPGTWEAVGKKHEGVNSGAYLVQRLAATY
ncbi:MAG: hypothetical protein M1817_005719 [Caeruleum heppii]|nr:MAG: hypothetical protein M1817_005719 [Caeruleum heppii]